MFERFTDRARRVMVLAQEEARLLGHPEINVEHLLLGLLHEGESSAALTLADLHITLDAVRARLLPGSKSPSGHMPMTPFLKRALELSLRESLQLGVNYIAPEHLLLAIIRLDEGLAVQILTDMVPGGPQEIRRALIRRLTTNPRPIAPGANPDLVAALAVVARHECATHGHDLNIVVDRRTGDPVIVVCARDCGGGPWQIEKADDGD
jgi:ATP-dependent Clp protease ATP-binding subunit ClpA